MNTIHFAEWNIYVFIIVIVLSWVFQMFKKNFQQKNTAQPSVTGSKPVARTPHTELLEQWKRASETPKQHKDHYLEHRADELVNQHKGDFDAILSAIKARNKVAEPTIQVKPIALTVAKEIPQKPKVVKKRTSFLHSKNDIKRAYILGEVLQRKF